MGYERVKLTYCVSSDNCVHLLVKTADKQLLVFRIQYQGIKNVCLYGKFAFLH